MEEAETEAAEQVFAPDQRFLLLRDGVCVCMGVAQEALALSSCGGKALVYSRSEAPVVCGAAYLPSRLRLPFQQLLAFRNRFIHLAEKRVVLNERYLPCELQKNAYDEPLEQIMTTAIVRRKRRCQFGRRVDMDVQYRFHPLNRAEKGDIDVIACTTVTHSMPIGSPLAQFDVLDTITLPEEEGDVDMSRTYEELDSCKDFLATYLRTRKPMYPWHVGTMVEASNGVVLMARQNGQVEVWMRPKSGEEWGNLLLLEHGFVTCLISNQNLAALRSSNDTIVEEFSCQECALDTLLLGHGFGVSASAATAALARTMAAFHESIVLQQDSAPARIPMRTPSSRLQTHPEGTPAFIREHSNAIGVFRAMGDGSVLVRFHNRMVVRFDPAVGVFRIISSDGEELSSTLEHPFPLTREQVSSIDWFCSWGFKSDEEVEAMHQKFQTMSAVVHTAVKRSSMFLTFLDPKADGKLLPSPISVAMVSPPQPRLQAHAPSGKDLAGLASRILEDNRRFLDDVQGSRSEVSAALPTKLSF